MALERIVRTSGFTLSSGDDRKIQHHLDRLEQRLGRHPEPTAVLVFSPHRATKRIGLHLRVQLGPLGGHLVSRQSAETADQAMSLAVDDIERQLERQHAQQRGEATFAVPSRRLPSSLRPSQFIPAKGEAGMPSGAREDADKETLGEDAP